jgi:hypothetical protein
MHVYYPQRKWNSNLPLTESRLTLHILKSISGSETFCPLPIEEGGFYYDGDIDECGDFWRVGMTAVKILSRNLLRDS